MATTVPRWRTFGSRFGIAEDRFAELTVGAVQESDELYLLGGSGANAKVRDDLMDIKVLREVNADGLERWEPVMKQPFPLPRSDVKKMSRIWGLPRPSSSETLTRLTSSLVRRPHRLRGCSR